MLAPENYYGTCPYYQSYAKPGDLGMCAFDCWEEPVCVTCEPEGGWRLRWRNTETGRFAKAPKEAANA